MKTTADFYQNLYIRFQDVNTDVFTLALMKGNDVVAGPFTINRTALRDKSNHSFLLRSCGSLTKFGESYTGGREIGYNLVVTDETVAHDWFESVHSATIARIIPGRK